MALANFSNVFVQLNEMGVLDSLFPFILIFTIIYAILNKTHIIGEGRKNFNVVIALTLSLMTVIPHVIGKFPEGADPIVIINTAIPNVSVIIVAILAVLLLIGIFGGRMDVVGTSLASWVAILAFLVVAWIFASAAGFQFIPLPGILSDPDTQALLIMLAVFALIIRFITSDSNEAKVSPGFFSNLLTGLKDSVKKP
ncbi:hypothetical protein HYY72_04210 [Candidatus Woesearchaeota archaeon]|nr:hypothetical protein [Candidatus Woesearchaeota archaeon]